MPSASSDDHGGPATRQAAAAERRYGRAGFLAAALTILLLELLAWVFMLYWYLLPVTVLPAVVIVAVIGYVCTRARGTVHQVGRGMLVGCLSAPLTVAIFIPAWIIAQAIGPL